MQQPSPEQINKAMDLLSFIEFTYNSLKKLKKQNKLDPFLFAIAFGDIKPNAEKLTALFDELKDEEINHE